MRAALNKRCPATVYQSMSRPFKTCTCCRTPIETRAAWDALPYVGIMGDDDERLELRNHKCGSTLAIVLEPRKEET